MNANATPRPAQTKPTVVLVHGAFADSSSWNGVITHLKQAGYPVVAAANPLRSLAGDAAYVASVIKGVEGPVVLAGHSYGGAVISEAAAGETKVKALVYVAAFIPDKGESALELSNKYPGSTLGPNLDALPFPLTDGEVPFPLTNAGAGTDLYIKGEAFHDQFAADVPQDVTDLMAATQRPIAAVALEEEAIAAAWRAIPSWSLVATADRNIPPAAQRFMSERAQAHTVEVDASHAVSVSQPEAVARLIEQAAENAR
ncbi:alpha/beta hydrolase [Streptomyces sp. PA03-5A]|nr:alpha/beta hydrolase [Streptomyces sp. PA03-5A]